MAVSLFDVTISALSCGLVKTLGAHALLLHAGVELGKRDFLGPIQ